MWLSRKRVEVLVVLLKGRLWDVAIEWPIGFAPLTSHPFFLIDAAQSTATYLRVSAADAIEALARALVRLV